ncbi:MAG: DivIVA domain-containing protein [Clostridiales bacterium]|nr:DivIVA domain-containing protein [Clostridiales bacterium]
MAGKRFSSSMSGYNKKEVDSYLKNIFDDFEEKLVEKDVEINKLVGQLKDLSQKYENIKIKEDQIDIEKEKISKALVRADETYAQIINDAKREALVETEHLENKAEEQREKVVDIKKELLELREAAYKMLDKYKNAIDDINQEYDVVFEEKDEPNEPVEEIKIVAEEENFEYVEYKITDDAEEIDAEEEL